MLKLCVSLAYDMSTMNLFLFQRVNNNMDSFLIKIERSGLSSQEKKGVFYSALIIYPNELSKAAQLSLAKAKSFKEVSKKWCYAFEFVELGL
ncbi:hypothetical protein IGI04_040060 [Brassica rapa subsp. trilocularis]|uniref:Uncharacterized protein n=1 Tax=Brassica rapa subsp. trilocularis TaxID=1813537 RepID=A0ABQ7KQB4_BRACM|nr:hypothetical protein IGI04_040060 [Brassica rapa subsp. trilocularis]